MLLNIVSHQKESYALEGALSYYGSIRTDYRRSYYVGHQVEYFNMDNKLDSIMYYGVNGELQKVETEWKDDNIW